VDRVADAHAARPVEAPDAAEHGDAGALCPPLLAGVVVVGHHEVAPREHGGGVEPAGDRLACARRLARRLQRLARSHQRLGGDAAPVGALAAEQLTLDDGDPQPPGREPGGAVLARRPAAQDDYVEIGHARPRALSIS
jgi:hypothetical protein